jgi:predicted RNA-binding protein YlxR (DUF448 family)
LPRTRHIPERSCTACGRKLPKRGLVRIVKSADGQAVVDPTGKANGRGSYLCKTDKCWEQGVRRGSLERGLRSPLSAKDKEALMNYYHQEVARVTPGEE